jgi:uncharacterized protein YdhG (YjbR/CyaY superfamily)
MMQQPITVDAYLAAFPEPVRKLLHQLRQTIVKAVPDAKEGIGYGMPAYKYNGVLAYFAGYKGHIGFYPMPSVISFFADALKPYRCSKGAVQFPLDRPLPLRLIARMVKHRAAELTKAATVSKKAVSSRKPTRPTSATPSLYTLAAAPNGGHHIIVPEDIVALFPGKRAVCTLNGTAVFHCAFMPVKNGGHFVYVGRTVLTKIKAKKGDQVSALFTPDTSDYQFAIPEELEEVLRTDPEGNALFQQLTPGKKRGLIHLVQLVKSSEKRIERALLIMTRLKQGIHSPAQVLRKNH